MIFFFFEIIIIQIDQRFKDSKTSDSLYFDADKKVKFQDDFRIHDSDTSSCSGNEFNL